MGQNLAHDQFCGVIADLPILGWLPKHCKTLESPVKAVSGAAIMALGVANGMAFTAICVEFKTPAFNDTVSKLHTCITKLLILLINVIFPDALLFHQFKNLPNLDNMEGALQQQGLISCQ